MDGRHRYLTIKTLKSKLLFTSFGNRTADGFLCLSIYQSLSAEFWKLFFFVLNIVFIVLWLDMEKSLNYLFLSPKLEHIYKIVFTHQKRTDSANTSADWSGAQTKGILTNAYYYTFLS